MTNPRMIDSIEAAVDHVMDTVQGNIVLGIPLGVGKSDLEKAFLEPLGMTDAHGFKDTVVRRLLAGNL